MTLIEKTKKRIKPPIVKRIAKSEGVDLKAITENIAGGRVVIPKNKIRALKKPCGIGKGLKTKINANIDIGGLLKRQF